MKALPVALLAVLAGCSHEATPPFVRPNAILIIRHAEKPADAADPGLSPAGRGRAEALPDLFRKSPSSPDPFPAQDFVLAAKASRHSDRPAETVAPLATALGLEVDARYAGDDLTGLAGEVYTNPRYAGKTVLICWHHGAIPELAAVLGATGVPHKWRDDVFDRVWVVSFGPRGENTPLVQRPQALMPGDAKE